MERQKPGWVRGTALIALTLAVFLLPVQVAEGKKGAKVAQGMAAQEVSSRVTRGTLLEKEEEAALSTELEGHWAWEAAKALVEAGFGGEELEEALQFPGELDRPVTPLEWNGYVARAVGEEPGCGKTGDTRYWLYVYTADEGNGIRSVVTRGYAAAGLAKIGNMYGFFPGTGGPLVHLKRFQDWRWLDERGYAGPCEELVAAGILAGYPDGRLRPEAPLTRGEAAALLKGWLEYRQKVQGGRGGGA